MREIVKIGMMSFAHMHAASYASCLLDNPYSDFLGIADNDRQRAIKKADLYKVKCFSSYEKLLASDIEAVIICSENIKHRGMIEKAAKAGKHILCEKPLATNIEDAKAIVEICKANNVKLMTAFPCRYHSSFIELKSKVNSNSLGKILAINGTNHGKCPFDWFVDKSLSGGGAVMDHTVHVIDLIRCLTGAEPTKVYAEADNRMYGQDFDDCGIMTIDFDNGMFATIDCSWTRPKSFPVWGDVTMHVIGENGSAYMDLFGQNIDLYSDITNSHTCVNWGNNIDQGLIDSFIDSLRFDKDVEITGIDGLQAVAVVEAAYKSIDSGKAINI